MSASLGRRDALRAGAAAIAGAVVSSSSSAAANVDLTPRQAALVDALTRRLGNGPPMSASDGAVARQLLVDVGLEVAP